MNQPWSPVAWVFFLMTQFIASLHEECRPVQSKISVLIVLENYYVESGT